jgi:hypothetical protein
LCRSKFSQLICRFVATDALMNCHLYQLYYIMLGQLHEVLVAFPDQSWCDPLVTQSFNSSLTILREYRCFSSYSSYLDSQPCTP